ncbi:MAG: helix-turn-helix transcriptional regulator, partial [Gorillibacterium sp.]|nr:helix-turn-helix transcriptional regulator [Gorillibacterium sp.]
MDVQIIEAQKVFCNPEWYWNSSMNQWNGFAFWYVFGGSVRIRVLGEEYCLIEGDSFIFHMDETHMSSHNPQHPLCVYTVYFRILDSDKNSLNFSASEIPRTRRLKSRIMIEEMLERCIEDSRVEDHSSSLWFKPILAEYLQTPESGKLLKSPGYNLVKDICVMIAKEPWKYKGLHDIISIAGYSSNHLIRLFKKYCGMTPYEFCIQKKIEYAK